jgi:hypothetical protein
MQTSKFKFLNMSAKLNRSNKQANTTILQIQQYTEHQLNTSKAHAHVGVKTTAVVLCGGGATVGAFISPTRLKYSANELSK